MVSNQSGWWQVLLVMGPAEALKLRLGTDDKRCVEPEN